MAKSKSGDGEQHGKAKWFWHDTMFYCPHCKEKFTYVSMWKSLAEDFPSVWEIMEVLNMSWHTVRGALKRHNLIDFAGGTRENLKWYKLSQKIGYRTPREMLINLRDERGYSFPYISREIGKPIEEVKTAYRRFVGKHIK